MRSARGLLSAARYASIGDPLYQACLGHCIYNCWLHQHLGDPTTVRDRAADEHGVALAFRSGRPAGAVFWRGWALAAAGEFTAASVQMRDAIAMYKAMGVVNQLPFLLGLLAGVHTSSGKSTQALALLTEALAIVERTQERWFEAELHRLRAEALLAGPA